MKASSRNSSAPLSSSIFIHFIITPSLDLSSEEFPYHRFETAVESINTDAIVIPDELMIGKQAERCFEHYLQTSERYELLANNIQIQGATATKGELDYLVYDKNLQQNLHIELACKFYLFDPSESGLAVWTGPNRKDSLDQKLKKLRRKQFPLLFATETSALLKSIGLSSSEVEQQLCLKAFLFLPKGTRVEDVSGKWRPSIVGEWMDLIQLEAEDHNAHYILPKKTQWLLPPREMQHWISLKELTPLVREQHKNRKTPLVYQKSNGVLKLFFIVWWS